MILALRCHNKPGSLEYRLYICRLLLWTVASFFPISTFWKEKEAKYHRELERVRNRWLVESAFRQLNGQSVFNTGVRFSCCPCALPPLSLLFI